MWPLWAIGVEVQFLIIASENEDSISQLLHLYENLQKLPPCVIIRILHCFYKFSQK